MDDGLRPGALQIVEAEDRLTACSVAGDETAATEAIVKASETLQGGKTAIVGSGQCSVEEQFALKALAKSLDAVSVNLVARYGEDDGLLMSVDRNPNVRGALMTGLIDTLPEERLEDLGSKIDSGEVTTVLSVKEELTEAGLSEEQLSKVDIVYLGTHRNATSEKADVVFVVPHAVRKIRHGNQSAISYPEIQSRCTEDPEDASRTYMLYRQSRLTSRMRISHPPWAPFGNSSLAKIANFRS